MTGKLEMTVAPKRDGGWCNWQHSGFWSRRYGFESCPPSRLKE